MDNIKYYIITRTDESNIFYLVRERENKYGITNTDNGYCWIDKKSFDNTAKKHVSLDNRVIFNSKEDAEKFISENNINVNYEVVPYKYRIKYTEGKLRSYIEKCFKDAFENEERKYDSSFWSCEWIMIKNKSGVFQFYPILWCKYSRVLRLVEYRLNNNLYKNFGIIYQDGGMNVIDCLLGSSIDYNFTIAMFRDKINGKSYTLDIFDTKNLHKEGECMPSYTMERLIFTYWDIDADTYRKLPEDDEKKDLPFSLQYNWKRFKELYKKAFGKSIGEDYEIICSSGLERM